MARLVLIACVVFLASIAQCNPQGTTLRAALVNRLLQTEDRVLFEQFKRKHNRTYSNEEEHEHRFKIFQTNMEWARMLNEAHNQDGGDAAVFGITKHSDLSQNEFGRRFSRPMQEHHQDRRSVDGALCFGNPPISCSIVGEVPPVSVDWRTNGAIGPVRDQAECGGCWSFTSAEVVYAAWKIAGNNDFGPLSPQQILDCTYGQTIGNVKLGGCDGGLISSALQWVLQNSTGLVAEKVYPFQCKKGCNGYPYTCEATSPPTAIINSTCHCQYMDGGESDSMKTFVGLYGPVGIRVDAAPWQQYMSGIIRHHCSSYEGFGNHAVQIIGYGTDAATATPYWLIKNSWGTSWGEDGYLRVQMGANVCGVANDVNFAFSSPPAA